MPNSTINLIRQCKGNMRFGLNLQKSDAEYGVDLGNTAVN